MLDADEWRQIDYLLWITQPFYDFTRELSKTTDATTHLVFMVYNELFKHIEQSINQLRRKKVVWKKNMLEALESAKTQLSKYYSQTDDIRGDLYALATMLAPINKFQFFMTGDWDDEWRNRYRKSFKEHLVPYQERLKSQQGQPIPQLSSKKGSRLSLMLSTRNGNAPPPRDEVVQYLDSGKLFYSLWPYLSLT
jgi:hypothetical protein